MQINATRILPHTGRQDVMTKSGTQDIDDFIYLISHDVRASVRALLELPQWIAEDLEEAGIKVEGSVAQSIDLMNRHTGRLDRMLVDLLTYSRIGRMQDIREIDVGAALAEVCDTMQLPSGFTLTQDIECGPLRIGERDILTLLTALLSNAVKHHDKVQGHIVVTAQTCDDMVILSVSDNGPGIEEEMHPRIFGAMTTLRPRDEVEGSGMGLANVRKIAEFYGGDARVGPSIYGRGCTIEVRLPRIGAAGPTGK
ncbi:sensor histidine kinase [Sulfitobacter sp. JB4-11]|uniref:sensor histidine kinase n=1 Tax=Sulfitobacter rhodophyticola TaxID=3238304 RepID=UPI0035155522